MAKFSRHPKELKGPALNGGRCCNHDKGVTVLIFQGNAVSDYSREIPHEGSKAMYWRLVGGVLCSGLCVGIR
jgi:hypothetical protein